jgi:hypothetical protein
MIIDVATKVGGADSRFPGEPSQLADGVLAQLPGTGAQIFRMTSPSPYPARTGPGTSRSPAHRLP